MSNLVANPFSELLQCENPFADLVTNPSQPKDEQGRYATFPAEHKELGALGIRYDVNSDTLYADAPVQANPTDEQLQMLKTFFPDTKKIVWQPKNGEPRVKLLPVVDATLAPNPFVDLQEQ